MRIPAIVLLLLVSSVSLVPVALGQDVTMSAEQKEYYFLVGQDAAFRVEVDNTHDEPIGGTLVSHIENTGQNNGTQPSSTNSDAVNIGIGISNIDVNLGVHNAPTTLSVDLLFSYIKDSAKLVDLKPITVHIVETSQQFEPSEPISASSQDAHLPNEQQDPDAPQPNDVQDRLQNNQLAQNSEALRDEIHSKIAQDNEWSKNIIEQVKASPEFAQLDEELVSQGYNRVSESASPTDATSGTFDFQYLDDEANSASITGQLTDSEITEIRSQTGKELDDALDALNADPRFQELNDRLESLGYARADSIVTKLSDGSFEADILYTDETDSAARITASIINGTVRDVKLDGEFAQDYLVVLLSVIGAAIAASLYAVYRLYWRKKQPSQMPQVKQDEPQRDYARESRQLLDEAKSAFDADMHKQAYSLVGQALRVGLSHNVGINKETTNADLLYLMEAAAQPLDDLRDCLETSSLVVFAKRNSDRKDFERILTAAGNLIK